jgi:uncharacterized membrane protein YczE
MGEPGELVKKKQMVIILGFAFGIGAFASIALMLLPAFITLVMAALMLAIGIVLFSRA